MPEAARSRVAAWSVMPRSISMATICVNVPLSATMPRKKAKARAQKRQLFSTTLNS